ncbi:MAG TPA: AraC family transcriptional regulator [Gammaproteobacteria bacterium]|nr:AraC family transcriptional regulator [Gammaproteobacteria bacterium]
MDILTEVVDALQLRATAVQRLSVLSELREDLQSGEAALVIVLRGDLTAGTASGDRTLLETDYLLLVGAQAAQFTSATPPTDVIRCRYSLQTSLPHPLARQLPSVLSLGARYLTDRSELGRAVELLENELVNTRLGSEFVTVRLAEIAFVEVLRKRQLEDLPEPAFLAALSDSPVRTGLDLIHRSPNRAWRVDELASGAGLSRGVFAERFHRRVGDPPLRYLRAWRMLNARRELARGGVALREVAARAGYRSANGFSRAFRRFFGYPPSVLRRVS